MLAATAASVDLDDLRYSPFGGFTTVRRRIAASLSRRHELAYRFRDVILTPGATAAITVALGALFTPTDRVVVISPCWLDYPLYLASLGLGCDLVPTDHAKRLDLAGIERAWTARTRGLVISQPASPTGVLYTGDELAQLAATLHRLGEAHGQIPVLISDEVHRDQIWSGARFVSPTAAYPDVVSVYSFGKAWDMQGQRVGYIAVSPHQRDREAVSGLLEAGMRITGHCAPTALMQHLAGALTDIPPHLGTLGELQRHARTRLRQSGYQVIDAQATRFVYARSPVKDDEEFVARLAHHGVLAMPSTIFHERGFFRLALNVGGAALDSALDVLADPRTATVGSHA